MAVLIGLMITFAVLKMVESTAACDSHIWCDGPLLHGVQMARLFPDSKTFVDMNLRNATDIVLAKFEELNRGHEPTKEQLRTFVDEYFAGPGNELEDWTPTDIVNKPTFLDGIQDPVLRVFGKDMCDQWALLGRKMKDEVRDNQDRFSLLYLPHPFIVPGGRFREIYYWDSYWVIKGLLTCEMYNTTRGMLENFVHLIETIGFIPNGARKYYTRRSQPPFFIPMVNLYYEATKNESFIREHIDTLVKEYQFWMKQRTVVVSGPFGTSNYTLNRYYSDVDTPRPEAYREDVETADGLLPGEKKTLYSDLVSAAESGWDFSSRWSSHDPSDHFRLDMVKTGSIVPVDLNSVLCLNEQLLAKFFRILGRESDAKLYDFFFQKRKIAIEEVFWNEEFGSWFDYHLHLKSNQTRWQEFYPSNLFPMYTGCQKNSQGADIDHLTLQYLKNEDIFSYNGGTPTTKHNDTNQQWDFPNAWPPLQDVIITSLGNSRSKQNQKEALALAQKWIYSNWLGWNNSHNMFEKYDVTHPGSRGGGGEYGVQTGFGWTNGVVLDLLNRYGRELTLQERYDGETNTGKSLNTAGVAMVTVSLIVSCFCLLSLTSTS